MSTTTTTAPTASAPARGRGRGRGGYRGSGRGGYGSNRAAASAAAGPQEAPEVAALRQKYGDELPLVQAVFPDWDDESILFALGEAAGQAEVAITRIAEGQAEQWGSVKSKKQPKPTISSSKPPASAPTQVDVQAEPGTVPAAASHPPARGGFGGRGGFEGRGRGGFRGGFRGAAPGGPGGRGGFRPQANGHSAPAPAEQLSAPVAEPVKAQPPKPAGPSWAGIASGAAKKPVVAAPAAAVAASSAPVEPAVTVSTTEVQADEEGVTETKVEVTEAVSGWEQTALTETEVSENPVTGGIQVEQLKITETTVPETTEPTRNGWGEIEPSSAAAAVVSISPTPPAAAPAPQKPAARTVKPGISWASIARPPQPKPAPVPAPVAAPVETPAAPAPAAEPVVITLEEATPLLATEVTTAPTDPWASTPVAAAEPSALPVGEGWAETVIAQQDEQPTAADVAQHQRAEQAVPPVGTDPAGPLDVHTPAPDALPTQQSAFEQPSALASQPQAPAAAGPPGLASTKRSAQPKNRDAAVIMPGSTPDVDKVGVQFGSLNLFGSVDAAPSAPQEQPQQDQPAAPQQSLYETSAMPQQQQIEQSQVQPEQLQQQFQQYQAPQPQQQQQTIATQTDPTPFGQFQQQPQQQQQHVPASLYGGGSSSAFGGFGGLPQTQAQQPQQSYGSRYPQSYPGQQAQQQQQHSDTFSPFGTSSPYGSQQLGVNAAGAADSISPYFSSQQQQPAQAQQQQQPGVAPSPVPASLRDTANPAHQLQQGPGNASAYGGFGQHQQYGQPSQGYPTDYSSLYNLPQDPMRNLGGFYNQYDQQQQSRPGTTEDATSKLGNTAPGSGVQQAQQMPQQSAPQQQQAQQQAYPPQMMPYGYPGYYNHYAQQHFNPYGGHQHMAPGAGAYGQHYGQHQSPYGAPYPGYGAAGARGGQQQQAGQQQGAYGAQNSIYGAAAAGARNGQQQSAYGGVGQGLPHPAAYGSAAYGSFDSQHAGQQQQQMQAQQQQQQRGQQQGQQMPGQDARSNSAAASKDVFGDRFFGQPY